MAPPSIDDDDDEGFIPLPSSNTVPPHITAAQAPSVSVLDPDPGILPLTPTTTSAPRNKPVNSNITLNISAAYLLSPIPGLLISHPLILLWLTLTPVLLYPTVKSHFVLSLPLALVPLTLTSLFFIPFDVTLFVTLSSLTLSVVTNVMVLLLLTHTRYRLFALTAATVFR